MMRGNGHKSCLERFRLDTRMFCFSLKQGSGIGFSCLGQWWSRHFWQCSRGVWIWHLGIWLKGANGGAGFMVLDDLEGFFQLL